MQHHIGYTKRKLRHLYQPSTRFKREDFVQNQQTPSEVEDVIDVQ